jgi:hypothetical protein
VISDITNIDIGGIPILGLTDPLSLTDEDYQSMIDVHLTEEDNGVHDDWFEAYVVAPMKDAKYKAVDVKDVVEQQTHLTNEQRNDCISYSRSTLDYLVGNRSLSTS